MPFDGFVRKALFAYSCARNLVVVRITCTPIRRTLHPPFAGTVSVSAFERQENGEVAAAEAACVAGELLDIWTNGQLDERTVGRKTDRPADNGR